MGMLVKELVFRVARPTENSHIKTLSASVWSHDYLIDFFIEIQNDPKSHFLVVENDSHEILGCINAVIYTFNGTRIGYLESLRVRADTHNQGLGTSLTGKAIQYLKSNQISQIGYVTGFQNEKSTQIALKSGFTQVARWPAAFIDCKQLPSLERKPSQSSELSNTEILYLLEKSEVDWYNCHWEFFPPSLSLIDHLRQGNKGIFLHSEDKSLVSFINQYENRLVGNVLGTPTKTAILDILTQIIALYDLKEFEEVRLFVQEKDQSFYSTMPFMDFSLKKGLLFFLKEN